MCSFSGNAEIYLKHLKRAKLKVYERGSINEQIVHQAYSLRSQPFADKRPPVCLNAFVYLQTNPSGKTTGVEHELQISPYGTERFPAVSSRADLEEHTLELAAEVFLFVWGDIITSVVANNWLLCRLTLQPDHYATLKSSKSTLDKHCAFHCASKRAADNVLPADSNNLSQLGDPPPLLNVAKP